MSKVQPGRFTAEIDGEFVVFIIGMRFNKLWKVHQWWPVFVAMPRMIKDLMQHPEKGLLSLRGAWSGRTVTIIQYWRSFEQLEAFARNQDDPHWEPWRAFNRKVGKSGDVGVYHETYRIEPGHHESIYSNMPPMGLALAGRHVAVGPRTDAARERMQAAATQA
jgi:Domain of unknown function (DUF4188)